MSALNSYLVGEILTLGPYTIIMKKFTQRDLHTYLYIYIEKKGGRLDSNNVDKVKIN